ncbi:helix-turn-helix domain-containing protein [Bifidobacterium bohemicum]|uniref:helix-turn-helix domain-containing protein n=1 Tax=Bifidobacterium bohemicum TaxID=638617 RepID=UPI000529DCBB|nr:helix-turn-helix transcriptional regulator [Bifidobacterium bohemicum]
MSRKRPQDTDWLKYVRQLGKNIEETREAKHLSQIEVANAADLSRYTYQKLESGIGSKPTGAKGTTPSNPSLRNVMAVAQALGVTLADLLPDMCDEGTKPPDLSAR